MLRVAVFWVVLAVLLTGAWPRPAAAIPPQAIQRNGAQAHHVPRHFAKHTRPLTFKQRLDQLRSAHANGKLPTDPRLQALKDCPAMKKATTLAAARAAMASCPLPKTTRPIR